MASVVKMSRKTEESISDVGISIISGKNP